MKLQILTLLLILGSLGALRGQATVTDDTGGALPDINTCSGTGTETITITFPSADADGNATVSLNLPTGVEYVCGSVTQLSGASIADAAGCDPLAPVFNVTGLGGVGSTVELSLDLEANCAGTGGSNAFTIDVSDSGANDCTGCSNGIVFEILEASLVTQLVGGQAHVNQTDLIVGSNGTVDLNIVNLGQGAIESFTFCIDNTSGFITTNSLTIGGNALVGTTSGTQICYTVNASDDPANFGGDGFLSNTEIVSLVRDYTVNSCTASGTTISDTYQVNYGCFSSECQTTSESNGNFFLAFGNPILNHSVIKYQGSDACNEQIFEITYTNNGNGDASAAVAYNVITSNGIGNNPPSFLHPDWSVSGFDLVTSSTVPLAYTGGTNPDAVMIDFAQFGSDPDGAGGLDDLDGDGEFDDLPSGESITYRMSMVYDCPDACGEVGVPLFRYNYYFAYDDQCGTAQNIGNRQSGVFDATRFVNNDVAIISPPNVGDGDPFNVELAMNFGINSNQMGCAGSASRGLMKVVFTLPSGVDVAAIPNATFNDDPATLTTTATTATLIGDYTGDGNGGDVRFGLDFLYTCPATDPIIPYEVSFICDPTCNCEVSVSCGTVAAVSICPGPCADGGLSTTAAQIERTTLGFTNANATAQVDASTISGKQLARVNPCDELILTIGAVQQSGTQFPAGTADNAHAELSYDLVGGAEVFEASGGTFVFYDNSAGTYSAPMALPTTTDMQFGGQHIINWDLTSLLPGGVIELGDSILLEAEMVVLENTSLPTVPTTLTNASVNTYNTATAANDPLPGGDTRYSCRSLILEAYPFHMPIRNDLGGAIFNGCSNTFVEVRWSVTGGPSFDPFPGEVRPYTVMDSFIIDLTGTGLILDPNTSPFILVRGPSDDDPNYNYQFNITPDIVTDERIVYINDGGTEFPFPDYILSQNRVTIFTYLLPTCESTNSSYTMSSYYQSNSQTLDLTCSTDNVKTLPVAFTTNFPTIQLTEQTGTKVGDELVECFDVRIRNTSGSYDTENIFLDILESTSTMSAVSATHSATNGVAVDTVLTLLPSVNGQWIQLAEQLPRNDFFDVEICVEYQDCGPQTLTIEQGFDCSGFPNDPTDLPCLTNSVDLNLEPVAAQLQGQILSQPSADIDLCDVYTYDVLLTSSGAANLLNPQMTIDIPEGMIFQDASISYPYNTAGAPFQAATPIFSAMNDSVTIILGEHTDLMDFLPGGNNEITGEAPEEDRQVLVRYNFTSDCDFVSGIKINFDNQGTAPCGDIADLTLISTPLNVNGIHTDLEADITLTLADNVFTCGAKTLNPSMDYNDTANDGNPYMTGTTDTVLVKFPSGFSYVTGTYAVGDANAPTFVETRTVGSSEVLVLSVPSGISVPDLGTITTGFSFDVVSDYSLNCGQSGDIEFSYEKTFPPLSCTGAPGGVCPSGTAAVLGELNLSISVDEIIATNLTIDDGSPINAFEGTFDILNADLPAGESLVVEAFCSTDASMTTVIGTAVINGPISMGAIGIPFSIAYTPGTCTSDAGFVRISPATDAGSDQCLCVEEVSLDGLLLPVDLTYFKASALDCEVELEWETASELNNAYFEVEHSLNGIDYKSLERVEGQGTSQETHLYKYTHTNIETKLNYYRLKQVDIDGRIEYSNVASSKVDCDIHNGLVVKPIPVRGSSMLTIEFYDTIGETSEVFEIYNTNGILMKKVLIDASVKGWNTTLLNVSDLSDGIYYIKGAGREVKKFIVIE